MTDNLLPPEQRKQKQEANQRKVLRFLRDEIWSETEVLHRLLGYRAKTRTNRTLEKMLFEGCLKQHEMTIYRKATFVLWGLTDHGLALAFDDDEAFEERSLFYPSRVALPLIPHQLEMQSIRLQTENAIDCQWIPGQCMGSKKEQEKKPDALLRFQNQSIAIEVERTVKSTKRYIDVLKYHLLARKQGRWSHIVYLSEKENIRDRIEAAFRRIESVEHQGVLLNVTDDYFKPFSFLTYEEWGKLMTKPHWLEQITG